MPSLIPCGSGIETAMYIIALSSFLVSAQLLQGFLKLIHQSPFLGHVSVYCLCCLHPETAGSFQSSPNNTLLEESHNSCANKFRWLVVKYVFLQSLREVRWVCMMCLCSCLSLVLELERRFLVSMYEV